MTHVLGRKALFALVLYAGMVLPSFAAFDQRGNPTGAWQSKDGIILVITCFKRLAISAGSCRNENEVRILLVNNINQGNAVNVECHRVDGDVARPFAYLSVSLEPLAYVEYAFKSERIETAPYGGCRLLYPLEKKSETTAGWTKLK